MISGSKSLYRDKYPNHKVFFNANIVVPKYGKIWWGDLDVTRDFKPLLEVSKEIELPLYVLREMDARFENATLSTKKLIKKAVEVINYEETKTN